MRTIAVRDEVYELLLRMKREGESFSDVILRLITERKSESIAVLEEYAGSLSESELEEIVMKGRKEFRVREIDF